MKKWKVSHACLDIIKKECPFYSTPIVLNDKETDTSKHIYIGGYNITQYVDGDDVDPATRFSVSPSLKQCEKLLNSQLNKLQARLDNKLASKLNQNQIDAIASYMQSLWVVLESPHSIITEIIKTPMVKALKQEKFEKASMEIRKDTNYTFSNKYSDVIKSDNSRTELSTRRSKECRLFDTEVEFNKSNLPDSNLFVLAKKMRNPKERQKFIKDFTSL